MSNTYSRQWEITTTDNSSTSDYWVTIPIPDYTSTPKTVQVGYPRKCELCDSNFDIAKIDSYGIIHVKGKVFYLCYDCLRKYLTKVLVPLLL